MHDLDKNNQYNCTTVTVKLQFSVSFHLLLWEFPKQVWVDGKYERS